MRRYILTGAPGSGKTALLRQLELDGYAVVEEAATDVIALRQALGVDEPWREPGFLERIVDLQRTRELATAGRAVAFFDRSPVCTLALGRHLGIPVPATLLAEVDRAAKTYEPTAFLVRGQGFVHPTAARRIGVEEASRFERIHEETYRELGFTLVDVPAGPLAARVSVISSAVSDV
ncbi:AAA family ATPase [Actinoplanes couchii]|nr:AAA family ATPase [Actinoplanes couchii]MDR6317348.1 putative ATPase [Actinoplanes couchii]